MVKRMDSKNAVVRKDFTSSMLEKVNEVAVKAGNQLTNTDNENIVDILTGTLTRITDPKSGISKLSDVRFNECAFPSQVKRFARMGLKLSESHFYVDLRKHGNGGQYDIGLWLQYQGEEHILKEFCKKGGGIVNIYKDVVMANEELVTQMDFRSGTLMITDHKIPDLFTRNVTYKNKDNVKGAYAIAYHADGSQTAVTIDKVRIERGYSAAKTKNVWEADYKAMVLKTVVHVLFKELRKYNEIPADLKGDYNAVQTEADQEQAKASAQTATEVFDADITEVEESTGEVKKGPKEGPSW